MALITAKDLSVGYGGQTVAEHLNFKVNSGDYLCIVGENGSGKSYRGIFPHPLKR